MNPFTKFKGSKYINKKVYKYSPKVPGATPKNPFSGLIARSWPSESGRSQAMSSPTTVT